MLSPTLLSPGVPGEVNSGPRCGSHYLFLRPASRETRSNFSFVHHRIRSLIAMTLEDLMKP